MMIDLNVSAAINKLSAINILLLNQSVLLKGADDNVDTLALEAIVSLKIS